MLPDGNFKIGPVTVKLAPTDKSVPTNSFLATAAPPAIVNAPPALLLVASVVLVSDATPSIVRLFNPVKFLLESNTNALLAVAVPGVTST